MSIVFFSQFYTQQVQQALPRRRPLLTSQHHFRQFHADCRTIRKDLHASGPRPELPPLSTNCRVMRCLHHRALVSLKVPQGSASQFLQGSGSHGPQPVGQWQILASESHCHGRGAVGYWRHWPDRQHILSRWGGFSTFEKGLLMALCKQEAGSRKARVLDFGIKYCEYCDVGSCRFRISVHLVLTKS